MQDADFMMAALKLAAKDPAEVPVGAVVVRNGRIIAGAHNEQVSSNDALAHAEMLAIRRAQDILQTRRLDGCALFVTLEPCPMCAGAIILSGLDRCVFGAFDSQYGCCGSVYVLPMDPVFHRHAACRGGLMEGEAKALLDRFFREIRSVSPSGSGHRDTEKIISSAQEAGKSLT